MKVIAGVVAGAIAAEASRFDLAALPSGKAVGTALKEHVRSTLLLAQNLRKHQERRLQDFTCEDSCGFCQDESSCNARDGCDWYAEISFCGTEYICDSTCINCFDESSCRSTNGCLWYDQDGFDAFCTQSWGCDAFCYGCADRESCGGQDGCEWDGFNCYPDNGGSPLEPVEPGDGESGLPFDPSDLENLDLNALICESGAFDCSSLGGIILEQIPDGACDDDKEAVCALYSDMSDLVLSRTCQTAVGLDFPSEIRNVMSAGSYCFNHLLCNRGSFNQCLDRISGVLGDLDTFMNYDDETINGIFEGVEEVFDDPLALLPTMCQNDCYGKFTDVVRGTYELAANSADCVAALQEMDMDDMDMPGLPDDLPLPIPDMSDLPDFTLPDMSDLPIDVDEDLVEEVLLLLESGCSRNANGAYCVTEIIDVFGGDDNDNDNADVEDGEEEDVDFCPYLQQLGCCGNFIVTSSFFPAEDRSDIFDAAAACEPPATALQRPCTDGLASEVVIVSSAISFPAGQVIDETNLINSIAEGAGVSPTSVIITGWENRYVEEEVGAGRMLQTDSQTASFEIILRGSETSTSSDVQSNIASDEFVGQVATATGFEATDIVVDPPTEETIRPESSDDGDDGVDVAVIVGGVIAACVFVGLIAGVAVVFNKRGKQRRELEQGGTQMAGKPHVKNPTNLDV